MYVTLWRFLLIYPWQQTQWQYIVSAIQQQRLPHALLLLGPRDIGKSAFAWGVAKYLYCNKLRSKPASFVRLAVDACDCSGCRRLEEGVHPDFFQLQPEEAGQVIKIEQIRDLIETLEQTGQRRGYRVVIIQPAESMNQAAANALLKTLEEPTKHLVFILICDQISALPATIVSRCQKLYFTPPSLSMGLSWLKQQWLDASLTELHCADYLPLRALKFKDSGQQAILWQLIDAFIQLQLKQLSPMQMAELCVNLDFILVFDTLWLVVMEILRLKLIGSSELKLIDRQQLLNQAEQQTTFWQLFQLIDRLIVMKTQVVIHKMNLNMRLLFEALFISIQSEGT